MGETYSVTAMLSAVDKNFSSVMQKAASQTASFSEKVKATTSGVGKSMLAIGGATTALGVKSIKSFGNFQASLNKAAVTAGGTSKDISGLADVANKMGADLPLSAQDSADAMIEMAQAGADVGQIKQQFPAIAQASTAAGSDLIQTAGVVQNAMNIWGDSLKSPNQAAAALVTTANASNASVEDMQQALATIGGTAKASGMSLQETSTAIGLLTNRGFSAAQSSQDLNHAILQMQAPSKVAQKAMHSLGISYTDAQGNMKSFPSILQEISQSMDGMTSAEKQKNLKALFGTAGMQAIGPLLDSINDKSGSTQKSWDGMFNSIQKSSSISSAAAKTLSTQASEMQKNVGSKVEQVGGNWEALRNKAMDSKNSITGGMLDMINKTITWAENSNNGIAKVIRGFIGLSPVLGPAIAIFGGLLIVTAKVGSAVGTLAKGFLAVGKGVVGLVSKLIGVATGNTAVGATSAGAATGEKAVGKSAEKSAGQLIAMGLAVLEIGAGIALVLGGLALLVLSITQLAKQGMNGVIAMATFGATVAILAGVFALLGPVLTASAVGMLAFGVAIIAAGAGVALFGTGVLAMGAGLALAGQGVTVLVNAFILLGNNIGLIIPIMSSIGAGFSALLSGILNAVITNIPIIGQMFIALGQTILNVINTLSPQIIQTVMNLLLLLVNTIVTYTPIFTAKIAQLIISILNTITTYLPQIILAGTNLIVALLNGIAQAMPRIITAAVNVIVAFINGIANNLGRIINAGINLLAKFIMGIVNAIPRLASIAVQAVMKFVYGVGNALGQVLGSGQKLINMFVKGIMDGFGKSQSSGKENANKVDSGIRSVSLLDVGKFLIQGFINGMGSMGGALWDAAVGIANKAKNAIKNALGIHSPSRVMKNEVGKWIPAGIAVGMNKNISWITSAAKNMVSAATISIPSPEFEDFRKGFNRIQSLSSSAFSGSVNGSMTLNASTMDQQNNALLRRIADKNTNLYMDSDTLVGTTSDKFNGQLGATSNNNERWSW
ncbi:Minor tail protein gp26-like protein [Pediococcus pentosaceus ATCC 25745]|uniref:Minor tail protein gp26-like protein n=1 Tax=Pediococcus pentosaceus (strain ATCC 25745 / CCUG 21536 / LMG 10740 / 183-1w) TaxID=278197 RepID=Q03G14_PEDPA|nr:phage tail tape measure protein [Pediococcus pentosaceus]ABJ67858.1 Minor tail protein gp26-like protein [Pediococcus pentosaceus ATCC 25745]